LPASDFLGFEYKLLTRGGQPGSPTLGIVLTSENVHRGDATEQRQPKYQFVVQVVGVTTIVTLAQELKTPFGQLLSDAALGRLPLGVGAERVP
jgi:hypothetical protein